MTSTWLQSLNREAAGCGEKNMNFVVFEWDLCRRVRQGQKQSWTATACQRQREKKMKPPSLRRTQKIKLLWCRKEWIIMCVDLVICKTLFYSEWTRKQKICVVNTVFAYAVSTFMLMNEAHVDVAKLQAIHHMQRRALRCCFQCLSSHNCRHNLLVWTFEPYINFHFGWKKRQWKLNSSEGSLKQTSFCSCGAVRLNVSIDMDKLG